MLICIPCLRRCTPKKLSEYLNRAKVFVATCNESRRSGHEISHRDSLCKVWRHKYKSRDISYLEATLKYYVSSNKHLSSLWVVCTRQGTLSHTLILACIHTFSEDRWGFLRIYAQANIHAFEILLQIITNYLLPVTFDYVWPYNYRQSVCPCTCNTFDNV